MKTRGCRRCGTPVKKSPVKGYPWFCPEHYEDLFEFETEDIKVEVEGAVGCSEANGK